MLLRIRANWHLFNMHETDGPSIAHAPTSRNAMEVDLEKRRIALSAVGRVPEIIAQVNPYVASIGIGVVERT